MNRFNTISQKIIELVNEWEPKLMQLDSGTISEKRNIQKRNIKQIVGHMIDSATNNTHRIIHLQYQESPYKYPDYANLGNNDRWIAIQNFNEEDWNVLVQTWKYCNLHIAHVMKQINEDFVKNEWMSALGETVTLEDMVIDYPRHLILHLGEIEQLIIK